MTAQPSLPLLAPKTRRLSRRAPLVHGGNPPAVARASDRSWPRRYRRRLLASDTLVLTLAALGALWAGSEHVGPGQPLTTAGTEVLVTSVLVVLGWLGSLSVFGTRHARVVGIGVTEYRRVLSASALSFAALALLLALAAQHDHLPMFVGVFAAGTAGLLLTRWGWRNWLGHRRENGEYLFDALVVGTRSEVEYVAARINSKFGAGYRVVGAALPASSADTGPIPTADRDVPLVADLDHVASAARALDIDAVVVAGQPESDRQFIRDLSWALEGTVTELVLASRLTDVAGPRIHFRPVEGLPLMHVELPQFSGGKHLVKRGLDVTLSAIGLLVLLPLLAGIALAVRLDSDGPALFRQERVGKSGQTFRMLKFRSMIIDAEARLPELLGANQGSGVLFKLKHDPRVTRVGRVLRKYSLDELPQLWNVLVGDMSLVGPRPPLQREVDGYASHVHRRLFIKPGLTGMWQVNGRSDLSWDESVRLDLYYVENWSLTGDLVILWRTLRVLVNGSGAY